MLASFPPTLNSATPQTQRLVDRTPAPAGRLRLGSMFGRHRVLNRVGEGFEGKTFLAEHETLGVKVVLKAVKDDSTEGKNRLREEACFLARFAHPNIVRILDAQGTGLWPYIVLEYIDGPSLEARIKAEGALPIDDCLWIGSQIAHALASLEAAGVVHRDIKPGNILLTSEGAAKLSDFGTALDCGRRERIEASFIGTPAYMAPEQAIHSAGVDHRADIYSLGVTLYEALSGCRPLSAETVWDFIMKHAHDTPPSPREVNPNVPEAVAAVVMKCLAKEPADRYQSAGEVREALLALMA